MKQRPNVRDKPKKKEDLKALYKAIEQMDEEERSFIAGAIAFAGAKKPHEGRPA